MTSHHLRAPLALAVLLALAATGCSGEKDDAASGPTDAATQAVPTTAVVGQVVGKLPAAARSSAVDGVTEVVDGWLDAAFTSGDYPRTDFADDFPGFTRGAARDAAKDLDQTTNAELGPDIDGLTVRTRRVAVDLLATKGKARTATARVRLVFDTTGDKEVRRVLTGRLFLTDSGGWTVFGYDLSQSSRGAR